MVKKLFTHFMFFLLLCSGTAFQLEGQCKVEGGHLKTESGKTWVITCAGDGMPEMIMPWLKGAKGQKSAWVITNENGDILVPDARPPFNFEEAGSGTCKIYHLRYEGRLSRFKEGNNIRAIKGCHDFSNPITVYRYGVNGGTLTTTSGETELAICAGDGFSDAFNVELTGETGHFSAWIITDEAGNILARPEGPPFDLEGAGAGTCLLYHLSYAPTFRGLKVGGQLKNFRNCFDLSNPITVVRETDGEVCENVCPTEGGVVAGGPYEFCVGDDVADMVADVTLEGNSGSNSQWVVTDEEGNILGLPPTPDAVDFNGAGAGTCLIWHLSFEDGLTGLEVGNNALTDLDGCYDLSDEFVSVVRLQPEGGVVAGGPYEFCVGDDVADMVADVTLEGNSGSNSQWVVTDEEGNILGLPPTPDAVDFNGAGAGTCLIWHLSFEDGLTGLEVGNNALTDLDGCYDLSDEFVSVVRLQPEGGVVAGGPYEFCVGDDVADMVADVTLEGNSGSNSQWVVTDEEGNILGLPPTPDAVDFNGAGAGTCLIWHLSFEDGLTGLEAGNNALTDLDGCYDLSDEFVSVVRLQPEGGVVAGGPYEFCVGDDVADMVADVTLEGNSGSNSQWVVTDEEGNILGLPPTPDAVDFNGAGAGTCLIWHLSFEDGLTGLEVGNNALTDLDGCYDLSDEFVSVVRLQPEGGVVAGGPYEFCVGDDVADMVADVTLEGNSGSNSQWVVTDEEGNILGLPPTPDAVDFNGAGAGTCLIWHLSFEDGLTGLEVGNNALTDLDGCYDLSDEFVSVVRLQPEGGVVAGGPYEFCVGDDVADMVADVTLEGNSGSNSQWVVTDEEGNILGLPPTPDAVDFNGAGAGTCLIWHLSFEDGLTGLEVGNNALTDLDGCYDLSDEFVSVVRLQPEGGVVAGGPYEFCVGDDVADMVADVTLEGNSGSNSQWVVTDEEGNILGLPPTPDAVDFNGAGAGTCLIWHLSFEDGLTGLEVGNNALTDLDGCYDLSDEFVSVVRLQPEGGVVAGGPYEFCVGDDVADMVADVTLEGNSGSNSQWVVTDEEGNILGLPPTPEAVDFNGAGAGTCLIWHLSFEDGLTGLEVGNNALTDLDGCYDLSDEFVSVVRLQPEGGVVAGGPYEFCVGDDVADMVADVTLEGNSGSNSQWVVTDEEGNILGLPPTPEAVDFNGAGAGTCLIWHLSFEDGLTGLEVGNNALTDLDGCYDLSDEFVSVVRLQPEGGVVAGGPYEFCVGDDVADMVADVTLEGNSGSNSQWVVTDEEGNILGLPPTPEAVDFNGAGAGTCLIWHLSFEDGLTGLEVGNNALTDLDGCYDLSDEFVSVVRLQPEGGVVAGGPYEFCVGDDVADMVADVSLEGNSGSNSQWVVTDEEGNILGLPPTPDAVDFNGAGAGTCLIWHLSFEDGLTGLEVGNNALTDLDGCYDLSDEFVSVVRLTEGEVCDSSCNVEGGILAGGPYEFCVGDDVADMVADVTLEGNSGSNSQWVVTDEEGNILGLPPTPEAVDFNGAGTGTCLIWHLSFEGEISGAEMGMNANDLEGCFSLSNPITVNRIGVDGGMVTTMGGDTTATICAGDGTDDLIEFANNSSSDATYQYVITNDSNQILGFPDAPAQNFEGAGFGICRVWGFSYTGNLIAEGGQNIQEIISDECFDLSDNYIEVRRDTAGVACGNLLAGEEDPELLVLYPNPSSGILNINGNFISYEKAEQIFVFNSLGQMVYSRELQGQKGNYLEELDLTSLPNGSYQIAFITSMRTISRQLIINRE